MKFRRWSHSLMSDEEVVARLQACLMDCIAPYKLVHKAILIASFLVDYVIEG